KWPWPRAAAAKRSGGMRSPCCSYSIPTALAPIPQTRSPICAGSWGFGSRWAGSGRVSTMLPRRRSSPRWNGKCCPAIGSVILSMRRLWLSTGATPSIITNAGTVPPTGSHPSTTRSGNPRPSRKRHRKPSTISGEPQYRWRRQAGVAARRQRPRTYTAEEKAEFFRLLHIRGNVSAVARELGYVRVTCYKWAHQAGIFTGKDVSDKREEFLRLRSEGVSRRQAAEQVGVDKRTAQDWDKGIRQFYGGRVYPDGRVVKYRPAEILANVKNPRTTYGHNDNRDVLERLERSISPRFLSLTEREQIHDLKATGLSIRRIGHQLSRAPSTISRELRRNATQSLGYLPYSAHRIAASRRGRPKERKLQRRGRLRHYVARGLRRRWSPEQISRRLVRDFPEDLEMRVGTETIYQTLYRQGKGALKREIVSAIRSGRVARKPRRDPAQRTPRF